MKRLLHLAFLLLACNSFAQIIYVNANASGTNDGTTWENAYTNLQDALSDASGNVIWVAAGTYIPTTNNDQTIAFVVPNNVNLFGGFNGTETHINQRNWNANRTFLSGDLNSNNTADSGDSYTILMAENATSIIDGFIIQYSYADKVDNTPATYQYTCGGGLFSSGTSNIFIRNCVFRNNEAVTTTTNGRGGAIFNQAGTLNIINTLFYNNHADLSGGAIYTENSLAASVINTTIVNNTATHGGGINVSANGGLQATNTIFSNNSGTNGNFRTSGGTANTANYCLFYNTTTGNTSTVPTGISGNTNLINQDPLFNNTSNLNGFRLQPDSPALDAGNNNANNLPYDLANQPRIADSNLDGTATISLGAYESFPYFTESDINLTGVTDSSVAWGDYDNDGDLDILLTGYDGSNVVSKIYTNNGNDNFTELTNPIAGGGNLPGIYDSSVAWGDYDNDGDLDILLTGYTSGNNKISKIYTNSNGNFSELTSAYLPGVGQSSVAWGDYDNDGDLDILLTGDTGSNAISKIYTNNGNDSFSELTSANLTGVRQSSVAWGDYDNDGDLDILLTGTTNGLTSGRISKIYTNNADGTFTELTNPIAGSGNLNSAGNSSVAWGDYDNDGDLDILLTGRDTNSGRIAKIYKNINGYFNELTTTNFTGFADSSVAWGDYDNDGDLDILLTGLSGNNSTSKIYKNEGHDSFTELTSANLTGVRESSATWGDYDNDGDLDILLTGTTNSSTSGSISKIYTNNSTVTNTAPATPQNVSATVNQDTVTFTWDAATDTETPSAGLSYNVFIKEIPSGTPLYTKTPMAQETDGWRKLPALGNAMQNTSYSWKLPDQYCGTTANFEFKVQAIDHNYAGSAFSAAVSFSVDLTTIPTQIYVNASATGTNDGSSWDNAYTSLQDALSIACFSGDIWVATGTYKPGSTPEDSFNLPQGATILGGFNGTETSVDERNWQANPTILSGDLNNNTTSDAGDSYNIVKLLGSNVTIDGFTLEYGHANDSNNGSGNLGAAIYNLGNDNIINNCVFHDNQAITGGTSGRGGAVYVGDGSITFTNSLFYNNHADQAGGAIQVQNGAVVNLVNCTLDSNTAGINCGGLNVVNTGSQGHAVNTIFSNNTGGTNGNFNNGNGEDDGTANYCLFYNGGLDNQVSGGNNIIDQDPLFVDAANGNYSLQPTSPALDAGDNSANTLPYDLAYQARIADSNLDGTATISLGAYESFPYFTESGIDLTGFYNSSVAWGDYDNDGDLDILLTGGDSSSWRFSIIYKNNGDGSFTELTGANLSPVNESASAWGDYDNDGDLDILLTGSPNGGGATTKIYKNNGSDSFTELTSANLTGVFIASVAWGDYDNDGDLDILLTGNDGSNPISKIYKNEGNDSFVELTSANLTGVYLSSVAWGDYDNDGDLDILLTGWDGNNPTSKIYKNEGDGIFSELANPIAGSSDLPGVTNSSAAWGDYDNDGDLDILLTGSTNNNPRISKIYINTDGYFNELTTANLPGINGSSAAWGDADNDGDLDILLTRSKNIYINNGDGTFNALPFTNVTGVTFSTAAWGDYNNDDDLDILVVNSNSTIYINNSTIANTVPSAPQNVNANVNQDTVTITWDAATDTETPTTGLSYNVLIKETPNGSPLYAKTPMAQETDGWRKLPALGNAMQNTSYTWNIPTEYIGANTDFIVKVQAIDHSFAGSPFSNEHLFNFSTLHVEHTDNNSFSIYPNPVSSLLNISSTLQDYSYELYSLHGQKVMEGDSATIIDVSGLSTGVYVLKLSSENQTKSFKIVKQ